MPLDPTLASTTTTATTSTTAAATSSRPTSPLPQPHPHPHPHPHHSYPSQQQQQQQQQQQVLPIRAPNPHLTKHYHDPSHPFLFPFTSSGRGSFVPRGLSPAGYPPPSLVYSHGVRAIASPHLDYLHHTLHLTTPPPHLHYPHLGHAPATTAFKGGAVLPHPKATPRSAVSDSNNGYKNTSTRERSRDDTFSIVRDRRVKITEDASLYALCRSWLRNSVNEESQPQQKDVMKALPKPLPASMVASYISNKKEDEKDEDEQKEDGMSVEHLSPRDLLNRHIKRAKRVRSRLREERLQRITRYRSRLRLLLPPPVEQFRNDTAAGN